MFLFKRVSVVFFVYSVLFVQFFPDISAKRTVEDFTHSKLKKARDSQLSEKEVRRQKSTEKPVKEFDYKVRHGKDSNKVEVKFESNGSRKERHVSPKERIDFYEINDMDKSNSIMSDDDYKSILDLQREKRLMRQKYLKSEEALRNDEEILDFAKALTKSSDKMLNDIDRKRNLLKPYEVFDDGEAILEKHYLVKQEKQIVPMWYPYCERNTIPKIPHHNEYFNAFEHSEPFVHRPAFEAPFYPPPRRPLPPFRPSPLPLRHPRFYPPIIPPRRYHHFHHFHRPRHQPLEPFHSHYFGGQF